MYASFRSGTGIQGMKPTTRNHSMLRGTWYFLFVGRGKGRLREVGGGGGGRRTGVVRWRLTLKTIILPTTLGKGHLFKDSLKRVYEAKKRHRVLKCSSYKLKASSKQVNLDT